MKLRNKNQYRTVPGRHYGTPKEIWGFRSPRGHGDPVSIACQFLKANSRLLGLPTDLSVLKKRQPRVIESLAAFHVIFQQTHQDLRVHRAYVTVHIGRDARVYLNKNRMMPTSMLPTKTRARLGFRAATTRALAALSVEPSNCTPIGDPETMWYPNSDELRLAQKIRLQRRRPREEWIFYVDALNGKILNQYDNLSEARGVANVFNPNPVIALGDYRKALTSKLKPRRQLPDSAYQKVYLRDLDTSGYIQGKRVTTAPTKSRVRRHDRQFVFKADDRHNKNGFKEAMVYYHIDNAIRYLEKLGYTDERAIFKQPLPVNVLGTREDNSWYSPGLKQLTFGAGDVPDAEDAETILHEFGHAMQDAITPDFGQSSQAAAIGEGFGDYFAASYFAPLKNAFYETSVMTWDAILFTDDGYDPPCLRRVDSESTFESFDHTAEDLEHENGKIWSATLWAIRRSIGRDRADRIIIESHFQLDGFTTFAKAARAILDANQNLFRNKYRSRLVAIFNARGIGPVV